MTSGVAAGIDLLLGEPQLEKLLASYFAHDGPFAGHTFDSIGENPSDEFTASDLLAVTLLDVVFPAPAVREVLENPSQWRPLLAAVPSTLRLWEMTDPVYRDADSLWRKLTKLPGVGPTKAGKLLARKRPTLIPIYDEVIATFLAPAPGRFWWQLRDALREPARRKRVEELARGLDRGVTTLRALDVAIWMRCGNSMNARAARIDVGLPAEPLVR